VAKRSGFSSGGAGVAGCANRPRSNTIVPSEFDALRPLPDATAGVGPGLASSWRRLEASLPVGSGEVRRPASREGVTLSQRIRRAWCGAMPVGSQPRSRPFASYAVTLLRNRVVGPRGVPV
ncbi:MAG: hypothetical protein EB039_14915, partial [Proteobacteria bacterium]|nr:hypothetical protein [Pseudomonadota bacterium]